MKAKFYGIGAGPGNPELLTLKADAILKSCDVIAGQKTALDIVSDYLAEKQILQCSFAMSTDMSKRVQQRMHVATEIMQCLEKGLDVAFVTLGDPVIYSTYSYLEEIIAKEGWVCECVPGITSFSAAAAGLNQALCEDDEILSIIPAKHGVEIQDILKVPGNKVLMKSGSNLVNALRMLDDTQYSSQILSHVSMENEKIYESIEDFEKEASKSYFTLAIVKQ